MLKGLLIPLLLTFAPCARAEGALRGRLVAPGTDMESTVVWIDGGEKLPDVKRETATRVMSQVNKTFSPALVAVRAGDEVSFENLDPIFHNVFSLDKANPFDLGLYKGKKHFASDGKTELRGAATAQPFKTPGKYFIFCNLHANMTGAVYAFAHGYFGQADKNGLFTLPLPPAGRRVLVIDGPLLDKPLRREVEIDAKSGLLELAVSPRSSPKRVRHTRKDGEPYSEKASGY
ncbi:MAG: plastocyanin/azurin family copper-binding protein [Elusimicrobiota bacterium]|nr:plastocyanin/azurin family copper-binding protein [Elusimicrobiota bacterium]